METQRSIRNVCVIGAGTMGGGIAAHLANLGFEVSLLDASTHSVEEAFARLKSAKPPAFYTPDVSQRIRLGNTEDNLDWIREANWVCEAIIEKLDAKKAVYARIEPYLPEDSFVTTNTSGLEISLLSADQSASFRRRFLGAHFFNPPRYLKLLELIPTDVTDPEVVESMSQFLEDKVARRVVIAKDTPGFIANRFGMWSMYHAVHVAEMLRLTVEEVDLITGPFIGRPKSGSFRLNDIVGHDVMRDIAANLIQRCPNDPNIAVLQLPTSITHLLARGWIGEKTGNGYYRRDGKELLALDLQNYVYRQKQEVTLPTIQKLAKLPLGVRVREALDQKDEVGEYLRHYLVPTLRYADYLKQEISHSVLDFDRVMEWGFGWEMGPFAMIDAIGPDRLGLNVPKFYVDSSYRSFEGKAVSILRKPEFAELKDSPMISKMSTFELRDLGDEVTAIALTTKMGVITLDLVEELIELFEGEAPQRYVLTNGGRAFSVGFDLRFFQDSIAQQQWSKIEFALARLQRLGEILEGTRGVAAIFGYCLGAGLEIALSLPQIVAQAEANIGLPESKVGLIPGGRGVTLMRNYNQFSAKRLEEVTMTMARGEVATNAEQARSLGYLRPTDSTVFHPDRLLFEAKKAALALPLTTGNLGRPAWKTITGPLSGMIDRSLETAWKKGEMTEYDLLIGNRLKQIVSRANNYENSLERERSEFLELCNQALTHARIKHMLDSGKPLRN
jgi:3-hydroxyacyl-CoA dehydrogenase